MLARVDCSIPQSVPASLLSTLILILSESRRELNWGWNEKASSISIPRMRMIGCVGNGNCSFAYSLPLGVRRYCR